jgi:uncharacterized membrane protein
MPDPAPPQSRHYFFRNFERVISFSDGVFSIALTLMVLSLAVPILAPGETAALLPDKLIAEGSAFLTYFISFTIIGSWWIVHHRIFQYIIRSDRYLLWMNLFFLFCITLVPFMTSLIIAYPQSVLTFSLYAISQAVAGFLLTGCWHHASANRLLTSPDVTPVIIEYFTARTLLASVTFFISIVIALFSTLATKLSWLLIAVVFWWLAKLYYQKGLIADNIDDS